MLEGRENQLHRLREDLQVTSDQLIDVRIDDAIDKSLRELPRRESDRLDDAATLLREVALSEDVPQFLRIPAYAQYFCEGRQPVGAAAG